MKMGADGYAIVIRKEHLLKLFGFKHGPRMIELIEDSAYLGLPCLSNSWELDEAEWGLAEEYEKDRDFITLYWDTERFNYPSINLKDDDFGPSWLLFNLIYFIQKNPEHKLYEDLDEVSEFLAEQEILECLMPFDDHEDMRLFDWLAEVKFHLWT